MAASADVGCEKQDQRPEVRCDNERQVALAREPAGAFCLSAPLPADEGGQDLAAPRHPAHLVYYKGKRTRTLPAQLKFYSTTISTENSLDDEGPLGAAPQSYASRRCVWIDQPQKRINQ